MTAPTLILLGTGGNNPQVARVSQDLRMRLAAERPELDVQLAFLDHGHPRCLQVAAKLAKRGVTEVVIVPLYVGDRSPYQLEIDTLTAQIGVAFPSLRAVVAEPIGSEPQLLSVLDLRLRDALRAGRIDQLDALVLSAEATRDVRGHAQLARRARQWSHRHRLPCLVATGSSSGSQGTGSPGNTVADAIRTLRAQGRRHVAVGSWFLIPDQTFAEQAGRALDARAVAVSAPIGATEEVASIILRRYVVAAMELIELDQVIAAPPVRHLAVVGA